MEGVCDNEDAALQNLTYAQQMLPITNPTSRNSPHPINHTHAEYSRGGFPQLCTSRHGGTNVMWAYSIGCTQIYP